MILIMSEPLLYINVKNDINRDTSNFSNKSPNIGIFSFNLSTTIMIFLLNKDATLIPITAPTITPTPIVQ